MRRSWILSLLFAIKRLVRSVQSGRVIRSRRIGACPTPLLSKAQRTERKRAFRIAYHQLEARIRLLIALPIDKLDRMTLKHRTDDIGRITDEA